MKLFGKRLSPLFAAAMLMLAGCGDKLIRHNASGGGADGGGDGAQVRGFSGDSFDLSKFSSGDAGLGFDPLLGVLSFKGASGTSLSGVSNSPPLDFRDKPLVGLMINSLLPYNKELPSMGGSDVGYLTNFNNAGVAGYWRLNEGLGGPYMDSSGNNRHGTSGAPPTPIPTGMFRSAQRFNGAAVIQIPNVTTDSLNLNAKTEASWAGWITTDTPATGAFILGRSNQYRMSYASTATTSNVQCQFFGGAAYRTVAAGIPRVSAGAYFHIVCVKTATALQLYMNGLKVAEGAFAQAIANSGATDLNFYIGGLGATNRYKGDIDEVAVWPRALSGAEVDLLHQRGNVFGVQYRAGASLPLSGSLLGPGGQNTYFFPVASDTNTNPFFISLPRQSGTYVEIAIRFATRGVSQDMKIREVRPIYGQ